MKVGILQGPNLDRLGDREEELYGGVSLREVEAVLEAEAAVLGIELEQFQSNEEAALLGRVWEWKDGGFDGVVGNPAAFSHTSLALYDALKATKLPYVEVHLSNVHAREDFRGRLLTARAAVAAVAGFGAKAYPWALRHLVGLLREEEKEDDA